MWDVRCADVVFFSYITKIVITYLDEFSIKYAQVGVTVVFEYIYRRWEIVFVNNMKDDSNKY